MSEQGNDNFKSALSRMQALCSKSEKSSGEIKEKLKKYDLNEEDLERIIELLKEEKFIDDKRYSEFFCRDKFKFNNWGKTKIRQSLRFKGINEETIEESLVQIHEGDYFDLIISLLRDKNRKINDTNIYSRKGKLFRYAASKGFENDLVYKAIDLVLEK